ncbi:hypothetical protein ACFOZ0_08880 [Streptomyces yaanensis]|uniref:Uncharacterized protein n=1 Tax=Streptomyces yaanensis TaxID=1142239 RepID=A0ABV7S8U1_9ACTN|nr:hypothetical protein [Streptomyces sp. CGMCC 4.7035]WNC02863.1 hypothetical protein Q2K21_35140 [Streptomyces sp. CGMCC 4.7035]
MELRRHPFICELLSLDLPSSDYVVAGSGPLLAHGLRQDVSDLDVVARGDAWKIASSMAEATPPPSGHGLMVVLFDGDIEIFDRWLPGTQDADGLIDSAEFIQGIPFCPLSEVMAWKTRSNRDKDKQDIKLLRKYAGMV